MSLRRKDPEAEHRRLLEDWRSAFPRSRHACLDLDELEAFKAENDRLGDIDRRDRPEVCSALPSLVTIGNTHRCNLTCAMCFKQLDNVENMSLPDLGLGRFESLGHELFPHARIVALSVSGDPLISRTIFQELDLLRSYSVRAQVTTNGMPLSKRGLLERLVPTLDTLTISFDGASAPAFNAIRRGASFERVLKNIRLFNEARDALDPGAHRPLLRFNTTLQWRNVTELPRIIELAKVFNVAEITIDHVQILHNLNREDSLERHKILTNRMLEEAHTVAQRLGIHLDAPELFNIPEGYEEAIYEPLSDEDLLAQGEEMLDTVRFDPALHERLDDDAIHASLQRGLSQGRSNADFVAALRRSGRLIGHLQWGVPQLGPSLIPTSCEKVSACDYPWRESFVEFNGVVAPCCNLSMDAGRVMGFYEEGGSFRDIWNGDVYRQLRRSLSSGRSYKFCRNCYIFESANEADYRFGETWFEKRIALADATPVAIGQVPEGYELVVTSLRGPAPERADAVLELGLAEGTVVATVRAQHLPDGWFFKGDFEPQGGLHFAPGRVVYLRGPGTNGLSVDVVGWTQPMARRP
jgi:MoaA/NifB/PqqE/SkfB family radical SAM enzyme